MQKNKLRVAFFGDDFSRQGKGTALFVQKIAEELVARHSHEVEVILLRPEGQCNSVICSSVRHHIISRCFSTLLSYAWFFITHRDEYDAIVFNRVVYPFFWLLRAKKKIVFIHDASRSELYRAPRSVANRSFEYFLRFVGQYFIDVAIAVSEDAKKWIVEYYALPPEKVHTIYPAAGDEYRRMDAHEREVAAVLLATSYSIKTPYILDVSRFDPHKNILTMLEAFFATKRAHAIPHTLILVGGPHTADYSAIVERAIATSEFREDVIVLDYVVQEDMSALYNCADMLVFPSLIEGFGLPVIEAMKCGIPVITSNISCLPEVAGGAALLVNPASADSISRGIQTLSSDRKLREELVEKGLRRATDFSWAKSASEFTALI